MSRFYYVLGIVFLSNSALTLPAQPEDVEGEETTTEAVSSNTTKNLYVIKSVVYEIGILTDGDDDDSSNETQEQVDVSFFNPDHNGSLIDLSNIPFPVQTNVSGVAVTGILPTDLGAISVNPDGTATYNGTAFPILPNKQVRISHNISTANRNESASILSNLPKILGLDDLIKTNKTTDEDKEKEGDEKTDKKDLKVEALQKEEESS
ncbi:hypothetical protein NQ318_016772 [Aromia moschata]|uniref:Uncharacterized protein n=1 Tax=Aromia moschata TaxID=1265417 RepID=A0AAV8Y6R7_9CUCU|nr:hypothetical protein NQ318_016772 [Aromia moschata]